MMDLSELEHAVLTKLLAGEHPLLDLLRRQLAKCRVTQRELTGHGFFAHLDVGDVLPVADMKVILDDVVAEIEGMPEGAGFVLYVERGRLSMLEGYGYDDPWPTTISTYTLRYRTGEERDWDGLRKVLR